MSHKRMPGRAKHGAAHEEEHENHERWLITYADMLTLLMVLFVVLYSMSATDAVKFIKLKQSLNRAFDVEVMQASEPATSHGDGGPTFISPMSDPQTQQEVRMMNGGSAPDPNMVQALKELRQAVIQIPIPPESSGHVEVGASREGIV